MTINRKQKEEESEEDSMPRKKRVRTGSFLEDVSAAGPSVNVEDLYTAITALTSALPALQPLLASVSTSGKQVSQVHLPQSNPENFVSSIEASGPLSRPPTPTPLIPVTPILTTPLNNQEPIQIDYTSYKDFPFPKNSKDITWPGGKIKTKLPWVDNPEKPGENLIQKVNLF